MWISRFSAAFYRMLREVTGVLRIPAVQQFSAPAPSRLSENNEFASRRSVDEVLTEQMARLFRPAFDYSEKAESAAVGRRYDGI
jgi:hypothetical protein